MKEPLSHIKNQDFNKSFRGYDTEEVDSHLDQVSYEFEKLISKNKKLESELKEVHIELEQAKIKVEELQIEREQLKSDAAAVIEATKAESAVVLKEAQIKAEEVVESAKEDADRIRKAVINLREEKRVLIAKLKAIIETQNEVLDGNMKKIMKSADKKKEKEETEDKINVEDIVEKLL